MDKNDIIEYVMHTPHNTNRAVLSDMLNQLTEGGGGGGGDGYLGLHTAIVNVTFDTSEVDQEITGISDAYIRLGYVGDEGYYGDSVIIYVYGSGYVPVTELGTPTQMILPTSDTYPLTVRCDTVVWNTNNKTVTIKDATVVSGSATGAISDTDGSIVITGDCSLNIKVVYQE